MACIRDIIVLGLSSSPIHGLSKGYHRIGVVLYMACLRDIIVLE